MPNSSESKSYGLFSTSVNQKIIRQLEAENANIFLFPEIEAEQLPLDASLIDYLHKLRDFDWIIFTDVFSVDNFLQVLETNEIDFFELDELNVCAIGENVADRLRFAQIHADLIPTFTATENIIAAFNDYMSQGGLKNLKILFPKEIENNIELSKILLEQKAIVYEMPIFKAKFIDNKETAKLKVLLKGGAIDEFIFTSPTDLISLKYLFPREMISEILAEISVLITDEVMFQMFKEHQVKTRFLRIKA